MVTDEEIEAALNLSVEGKFDASLARYQDMLTRAEDTFVRMRVLFGIVTCSTHLRLNGVKESAIEELKKLPDFAVSQAFIALANARAADDFGQAQEALDLIDSNLHSDVLERDDFRDWKYEHLFMKGRFLVQLKRWDEALSAFDAAHVVDSDGQLETEMLIERANCFIGLGRYAEAYNAASQVSGDEDYITLAMQYMAECLLWQRHVEEAMTLYRELQKRLPSRFVDEQRVQRGIRSGMEYLESRHPQWKPF